MRLKFLSDDAVIFAPIDFSEPNWFKKPLKVMYIVFIRDTDVNCFDTPILLCVFNRPDLTRTAIETLRSVKPQRLYISADGPRLAVVSDSSACAKVREEIQTIDWPCNLKIRFSEINEGCGRSISGALEWFFDDVEEGIILEDDILPVPYFFQFAKEMLDKFRDNDKIFMVSGTNLYPQSTQGLNYFFTSMPSAWGWATWRRAWEQFDFNLENWSIPHTRTSTLEKIDSRIARAYMALCFDDVTTSKVDTWDYQWQFSGISNSNFGVIAGQNLVANIGVDGTHSEGVTKSHFLKTSNLFKLDADKESPILVAPHKKYERLFLINRALPLVLKRKLRSVTACISRKLPGTIAQDRFSELDRSKPLL